MKQPKAKRSQRRRVRARVWKAPAVKLPTLTPRQRVRMILSARPFDASNVDVLYRGVNGYRTVTLKNQDGGFTNYDFRAEARRTSGYPSARVQYRPHAEWFARQPDFEVLIPRAAGADPPSLDELAARVMELEFLVAELLERDPMTLDAPGRREGY